MTLTLLAIVLASTFLILLYVESRIDYLERANQRLSRDLRDLEERLPSIVSDIVGKEEKPDVTAHRGFVFFYFLLLVAATGSAAYIYGKYGKHRWKDIAEFLSYIFPCFAGVIGGLGLYYRDIRMSEIWFWCSGILIGGGLVSFVLSKENADIVGMWVCALVLFIMSATLVIVGVRQRKYLLPKTPSQWAGFSVGFFFMLLSAPLLGLGYVYEDIIKNPTDWQSHGPIQSAVFQLVGYIERMRRA